MYQIKIRIEWFVRQIWDGFLKEILEENYRFYFHGGVSPIKYIYWTN